MTKPLNISVVMGANYGDEGKGATTRFVAQQNAHRDQVNNIKSNGTAQAGHTVKIGDQRFVFSHFGAGHLQDNVSTIIDKNFFVHPRLFIAERDELINKFSLENNPVSTFVNAESYVVLSADVAINRTIEHKRKKSNENHGSCGLGFFEATRRSAHPNARVITSEISDFYRIQDYINYRVNQLGLTPADFNAANMTYFITEDAYNEDIAALEDIINQSVVYRGPSLDLHQSSDTLYLFENAQGLLLDKDSDRFPHVTPSHTNSVYIEQLIRESNMPAEVELIYATRPYLTKHGAGPFPEVLHGTPKLKNFVDTTNVYNDWQEHFQIGVMLFDEMIDRCKADFHRFKKSVPNTKFTISLSCCDQIPSDGILAVMDGKYGNYYADDIVAFFKRHGASVIMFESEGNGSYC